MGKAGECLCLYVTTFSTSSAFSGLKPMNSSVGDLMHALMGLLTEDIALHMLKESTWQMLLLHATMLCT